jgi:hypothetical protein
VKPGADKTVYDFIHPRCPRAWREILLLPANLELFDMTEDDLNRVHGLMGSAAMIRADHGRRLPRADLLTRPVELPCRSSTVASCPTYLLYDVDNQLWYRDPRATACRGRR